MNAREFRIGNIVYKNYFMDGVSYKTEHEISGYDLECLDVDGVFYQEGEAEGIPLTEEWLLKFGFEQEEGGAWYKIQLPKTNMSPDMSILSFSNGIITWHQYNEQGMTIEKAADIKSRMKHLNPEDKNFILKNDTIVLETKFQYVHQLQNLYFALTGKELEIKE